MKVTFESENIDEMMGIMRMVGAGYLRIKAADEELKRLLTDPPKRKETENDPNHDHC